MIDKYTQFACLLTDELIQSDQDWNYADADHEIVTITNNQDQLINLNLTPFDCANKTDSAKAYFKNISSIDGLIESYNQINKDFKFETNISELPVSDYSKEFLDTLFINARKNILSEDVILIVDFVKKLDHYCAIKSIESLLYGHADLELLRITRAQNWNVHFDHIAIRCGSSENESAKRVAELLISEHGYSHPQITTEKFYLFKEGWSAYPLYKILSNGQVLRIFVDQSERTHPQQIIQHWNDVYGFTAHHLAMRLTTIKENIRSAIPLPDIIEKMTKKDREVLTPTGYYTNGLLSQVFTKPVKNKNIPNTIIVEKKQILGTLSDILVNAKLLEIVSRKEMNPDLASKYFELYDIEYIQNDSLHSAVYYQYFLPTQAAHVIKSSIEV